ncbi:MULTISPECIES: hypothetical protein [unclassified Streptomyces]|uniref:hypothetical protein n=1 Tax=unclassified Streptomyces TaxID=2593676 RepID=UPI0015E19C5B|nr:MULTISPECIES: hypothetical protein [unclassified Streptomyces]
MSTPVNAEQAWRDLQRIRVPQERVLDEAERSASGGPAAAYGTAALMWVFLAGLGLDLPRWGVWLAIAAYVALLGALAAGHHRRSRMRLHRTRYTWRMSAAFAAGGVAIAGVTLLSGGLAEPLGPPATGLVQATVSTAAFLLFVGPAGRWATGSFRGNGEAATRQVAGR